MAVGLQDAIAGSARRRNQDHNRGAEFASDTAQSVRFAKSAAEQGADGIISLPPHTSGDDAVIAYYKAIGSATPLPLMVQAVGNMSVELIGKLYQQVPTLKAVKDEAGNPLLREKEITLLTSGHLADFSGGGGRTLLTEMYLGFSGCCPYVGLSDLYQKSFELWHSGQKKMHLKCWAGLLPLITFPEPMNMCSRHEGSCRKRRYFAKAVAARSLCPPKKKNSSFARRLINS